MTSADRPLRLAASANSPPKSRASWSNCQSPTKGPRPDAKRGAFADLRKELAGLAEVLGTTHHRLIFIGRVSVGKTTAICHLVGLTAERDKKKPTQTTRSE